MVFLELYQYLFSNLKPYFRACQNPSNCTVFEPFVRTFFEAPSVFARKKGCLSEERPKKHRKYTEKTPK